MENKVPEKQEQTPSKDRPTEILVGFNDNLYHFGISGGTQGPNKTYLSTNSWDARDFFEAGKMAAENLHRSGKTNYRIINGYMNEIIYDIPEEEARQMIKMRCDDPFWSGPNPPSHLEKITCRELIPEQIAVFEEGLNYQLQILQGKIKEPVKVNAKPSRFEIYSEVNAMGKVFSKLLMNQKYSDDSDVDDRIKQIKLVEAMLTGRLDLSPPSKQ